MKRTVSAMIGRAAASRFGLSALLCLLIAPGALAQSPVDESVRAAMLKHRDGLVAHVETEYNDLFILKRGNEMAMSTRYRSESNVHSVVNLADPDDLPATYTRLMSMGLVYANEPKRILMIGLGAGSVSTYLTRAMPNVQIDVVDIDHGVIDTAKKYFGLRETDRLHFIAGDGRVYLTRHKEPYDLILLDAYRELGVPFHLLTKEFYVLLKEHLASGGAIASNVTGGTRLYSSSILTMRAVFPTVDVYAEFETANEAQGVLVAVPAPEPDGAALKARAEALESEYHFRYPLPELLTSRIVNHSAEEGQLLTDDFAPVNLYEVEPLKPRKRP